MSEASEKRNFWIAIIALSMAATCLGVDLSQSILGAAAAAHP